MSDQHSPSPQSDPFLDALYKGAFMICCLPLAPAIIVGLLLGKALKGRDERYLALVTLLAIVGGLFLYFVEHPMNALNALLDEVTRQLHHSFQGLSLLHVLVPVWAMSLFLAPAVGVIVYLFQPTSVEERAMQKIRQQEETEKRAGARVRSRMGAMVPYGIHGQGILGAWIDGDLMWRYKKWFVFPTQELGQHGVVIGSSGSGKTETLLRLAVFAAKILRWQVIYIDAKGDYPTAARFVAAMRSAGVERIKCFPSERYNGWVGDADALLNRLLAIEDFSESAYYKAIAENIVALALEAGPKLPTSSQEFLRRLRMGYLLSYYKDIKAAPEETAYLEGLPKKDFAGVYSRYRATFAKLRGKLDGIWSYDNIDAAYILLDGLALREIASGLGRYFVEDFAHFAGLRKERNRRVLFIFDELSAVDADVTNLFERVRSKGVSIFVSGQSYEGLGFRGMLSKADRLISAATTILMHANSSPEEMIRRAGKKKTAEAGYGFENEEDSTGRGTMRVREELRVNPDAVRQLRIGELYCIAHGRAERVQVAQIAVDLKAQAEADLYVLSVPVEEDVPVVEEEKTAEATTEETQGEETSPVVETDPDMIE